VERNTQITEENMSELSVVAVADYTSQRKTSIDREDYSYKNARSDGMTVSWDQAVDSKRQSRDIEKGNAVTCLLDSF